MAAETTSPRQVVGRRIGSAFIDLLGYWLVYWGVFLLVANSGAGSAPSGSPNLHLSLGNTNYYLVDGAASRYWAASILVGFLWFGLLPGLTGWTPGKLITGLRVVNARGQGAGVGRNLLRALLWLVDGFPYILPGLVGFVMILSNKGRRVADMVAHTYVVAASDAGMEVSLDSDRRAAPAGWYPDPGDGSGRRWWDGSAWTEHRA